VVGFIASPAEGELAQLARSRFPVDVDQGHACR